MGFSGVTEFSSRSLSGIYNLEAAELMISETATSQSNAILESQPKSYEFVLGETENEFSEFFRKIRFIESKIEFLQEFYIFNDPIEIRKFLFSNDYLFDTLYEAHHELKRIFGESVINIHLEFQKDPDEMVEQLFVIVKTNRSPEESLSLLDKFDQEWWLDIDADIRQNLEIDIEIA